MRKPSHEEVAAAARARLELLARDLDRTGLTRLPRIHPEPPEEPEEAQEALPEPVEVAPAGRHLPARRGGGVASLRDLLPETLTGRTLLDGGAVRILGLVVLVAVVLGGVGLARSHSESRAVAPAANVSSPAPDEQLAPVAEPVVQPAGEGAAGPVAAGGDVVVHVAGRVRRPGVVELPPGSRVADALRAAGGARRGAELAALNLARPLVDGEQVLVSAPGDAVAPAPAAAAAVGGSPAGTGALVSLNTADAAALDTLPGVGPVTAAKILDWRTAQGGFTSVDELLEISGIGEKTFAEIAPHVTL